MTVARTIYSLLSGSERRRMRAVLGLMVVGMLLETLGLGLVVPAVSLLVDSERVAAHPQLRSLIDKLGNPSQADLVSGAMLALVGVYLVKTAFLAFLAWRQARFAYDVQARISKQLFTSYLRQPYTFHLQRNSAQLIRNTVTEVSRFTGALLFAMALITEGLVVVGVAALLIAVEPLGAMIVGLALGAATLGFNHATRTRVTKWGVARQHHEGLRLQHLQQGLGGAKDVKLLGREQDFIAQYSIHNLQSARVGEYQATIAPLPRLWLELLAVVGLAILVLTMFAQGRAMPTIVSALALFAAAAFRLMPSVIRILGAVQGLRYDLPVITLLHDELGLSAPDPLRDQGQRVEFKTDIELRNVSFTYPGAHSSALDDVSLRVPKGESVGFVGPSGSGKSTLVDIVLGLLTPDSGLVTVDGDAIQRNLRSWQNHIGYVPQAIYLTDDTLRRNVAFGLASKDIDDAAVWRALRAAQLEEFVAELPAGLDTTVGERGIRLSGGQRQRIGVARALYHDPSVLVLDEATSALDTATEKGVIEAVNALQGEKTILIVAHRLSTVEHCTRIYRLVRGRVVSDGAGDDVIRVQRAV